MEIEKMKYDKSGDGMELGKDVQMHDVDPGSRKEKMYKR